MDKRFCKEAELSRFMKFSDYRWNGVGNDGYGGVLAPSASGDYRDVQRFVLFGGREDVRFHFRYFEVGPGGYSRLEKHRHAHCVLGLRGRGRLIMGRETFDLGFMDAAYIAPDVPHQLINETGDPFGFFCAVDAERDDPRPLDDGELAALLSDPVIGPLIRTGEAFSCELNRPSS